MKKLSFIEKKFKKVTNPNLGSLFATKNLYSDIKFKSFKLFFIFFLKFMQIMINNKSL